MTTVLITCHTSFHPFLQSPSKLTIKYKNTRGITVHSEPLEVVKTSELEDGTSFIKYNLGNSNFILGDQLESTLMFSLLSSSPRNSSAQLIRWPKVRLSFLNIIGSYIQTKPFESFFAAMFF